MSKGKPDRCLDCGRLPCVCYTEGPEDEDPPPDEITRSIKQTKQPQGTRKDTNGARTRL